MPRFTLALGLLSAISLTAACSKQANETAPVAEPDAASPAVAGAPADTALPDVEWRKHGLDDGENRFSTLADINADNVGDLGLACPGCYRRMARD